MGWIVTALTGLALAAPNGFVSLHVGVHREAGGPQDLAADGASGLCRIERERILCPADDGPVRFRWGPGGPWALHGTTELAPGQHGVAFVLADEATTAEALARLAADRVDALTVRDLFVRTGDHPVAPPSRAMLDALFALAEHPDRDVRLAVIDALVPWWRHTASDPLPLGAPQLVPGGLIERLADDRDVRVRRRLANRLREVNEPGEPLQREARAALTDLARESGGVQRAALGSLKVMTLAGRAQPEIAWQLAMERVASPGPPGRAAANLLGRLAAELEPSDTVDPERAIELVFLHHRERTWHVWDAWRDTLGFDAVRLARLLRETVGYDAGLMAWMAEHHPDALAGVLSAWEPERPHSDRWRLVTSPFRTTEAPALRALLDRPRASGADGADHL